MYYRTNGAYRRTKMIIDVANIILTIIIGILFIGIFFLGNWREYLFPAIFAAGGLTNGLTGIKHLLSYNRTMGIILVVAAFGLFLLSFVCWRIL